MARVVRPTAVAGDAERLAWIAGRDEIHTAAPRDAVEGSQVVPDKRRRQGLVVHPRHEGGRRVGFPLDVTHSPVSWLGDMDPKVETAIAGAEGKPAEVAGFGLEFGM